MLQAQQRELQKVHSQFPENWMNRARHELHSFYIQAYHLKDALIRDATALGVKKRDVERAINKSPALGQAAMRLADDLGTWWDHWSVARRDERNEAIARDFSKRARIEAVSRS